MAVWDRARYGQKGRKTIIGYMHGCHGKRLSAQIFQFHFDYYVVNTTSRVIDT